MSKAQGVSPDDRLVVLTRAFFLCERCGKRVDQSSIHHRTPRGMGGTRKKEINEPQNLLLLCGSGTTGCHGWIESHREEGYETGFLVRRGYKPEETPITPLDGKTFIIHKDGSKEFINVSNETV